MLCTCLYDINKHCLYGFERLFSFLVPNLSTTLCSGTSLTCKRPFQISPIWNTDRIQVPNNLLPFPERAWTACCRSTIPCTGHWYDGRGRGLHPLLPLARGSFYFVSTWQREGKHSPDALSVAGFFYVGNYLIISVTDDRGASVPLLRFIYYDCLQVGDNRQNGLFPLWWWWW